MRSGEGVEPGLVVLAAGGYPTGVSAPGVRDVSETMLGMTTAPVRGYSCGPEISSTNSAVGRPDNAWTRA
ncbi:hypothetical protein GCM10017673_36000 [Streptosporangium violaceochromogenes]|nr:hypothetical protein GCM10017673_36000 [Streptosporangium violaceochromogenes]